MEEACKTCEILEQKGHKITLVNARFVKPIDVDMLDYIAKEHKAVVTLEEQVYNGSYGQAVAAYYMRKGCQNLTVKNIAIEDMFVEHGEVEDLRKLLHMDAQSVAGIIEDLL